MPADTSPVRANDVDSLRDSLTSAGSSPSCVSSPGPKPPQKKKGGFWRKRPNKLNIPTGRDNDVDDVDSPPDSPASVGSSASCVSSPGLKPKKKKGFWFLSGWKSKTVIKKEEPEQPSTAEKLVNKGFSLRQLLTFYSKYRARGMIGSSTTTLEVVKQILIPETVDPPRSYMESAFMESFGGGKRAQRLVSHAWKSRFVNTVLNIVLDATDFRAEALVTKNVAWIRDASMTYCYNTRTGLLEADKLLDFLDDNVLSKTYWLCIFAVDEHHAICGDCYGCNRTPEWLEEPQRHLKADPCLICGNAKYNPCGCGSIKYTPDDPEFEIDKFEYVAAAMEGIVVSLDPDMSAIKRVWVVAEIGSAMQHTTASFRLALGLANEPMQKLEAGEDLMETVEACESTSDEDKRHILAGIEAMPGGIQEYDTFINCMLEINFGRCSRLSQLSGSGQDSMTRLRDLQMDFQWNKSMQDFNEELLGEVDNFRLFNHLQKITLTFRGLKNLCSLQGLGARLAKLKGKRGSDLTTLRLDFDNCVSLVSTEGLREIQELKALRHFMLNFEDCANLSDIVPLGESLPGLRSLRALFLNFEHTSVSDVSEIANNIMDARYYLRSLDLNYKYTKIQDVSALAVIEELQTLRTLKLDFKGCTFLADISALGSGIEKLGNLQEFHVDLRLTYMSQGVRVRRCFDSREKFLEAFHQWHALHVEWQTSRMSKIFPAWCSFWCRCCFPPSVRRQLRRPLMDSENDSTHVASMASKEIELVATNVQGQRW